MKLSEIKCSLFRPAKKEGRLTCRFLMEGGFCELPDYFDCQMTPKREKEYHSYSSLSTYMNCKRKYHLRYNLGISPKDRPDWAIRGSLFHEHLAAYYRSMISPGVNTKDTITTIASTFAEGYIEFYHDYEEGLQVEVEARRNGLLSYIDLIKGDTIIDHKFAASFPKFLDIAFQASFYFRMTKETEKFMLNHIKTPSLRLKGGESLEEFSGRLAKDIRDSPNKYFDRKTYSKGEFVQFGPLLDKVMQEIEGMSKDSKSFYINPSSCSARDCEYEPICLTGTVDEKLFKTYKKDVREKNV